MKLFRILTEAKNDEKTRNLVALYFDGFTAIPGVGFWHGQAESTVVFEFYTLDSVRVYELAKAIKVLNEQESVLVEEIDCKGDFV